MHSTASKKKTILNMFLGKCAHCLMDNKYHYFYYYYKTIDIPIRVFIPFLKSIFRVKSKKNSKISEVVSLFSLSPTLLSNDHFLNSLPRQWEPSFCLSPAQTSIAEMPPSFHLPNLLSTKTNLLCFS